MTLRDERGAVTAYAMSFAVLLVLGALVAAQVAGLLRLRHQVASAADLAALAASRSSVSGDDGCAAARELARRNHADVVRCRMDYDVATVTARGESERWWGHRFAFESTARAAPEFYLDERRHAGASSSSASSSRTAPALSRGELPLPHLGE